MPLTPTDVANKQFRIAFRGYSLDEVDAFLDEVETELSRLLRDNAELRHRATPAVPAAPPSRADAPAAPPQEPPLVGLQGQEAALRTLLLAQRTADEAIAEARAEAEEIVSSARAEADHALTSARTEAASTLGSAREEAEETLTSARAEASRTLATSQDKAARIDEEVAARITEATGDLEERRRALEVRIDELRAFEREYRTRLKAYLEGQLRELDSRTAPDDGGVGVPPGARAAAVSAPGAVQPGGAPDPAVVQPSPPTGPPREATATDQPEPSYHVQGVPDPVGPFTIVPSGGGHPVDPDATPSPDN